ncbi:MAG: type II secretion system protein [Candidatus Electrothrix sp. AW5]|nr:type II secretion system protein [Candidatus Electrothrix gigas]
MKKQTNQKGFTLVELTIVVAVIAILVGLATPYFFGVLSDTRNESAKVTGENIYSQLEMCWAKNCEAEILDTNTDMVPDTVACVSCLDPIDAGEKMFFGQEYNIDLTPNPASVPTSAALSLDIAHFSGDKAYCFEADPLKKLTTIPGNDITLCSSSFP